MKYSQKEQASGQKESERERERRMFEENLKRKKQLIRSEFLQFEETRKIEQIAVETQSEIQFKSELNKIIDGNKTLVQNVQALQKKYHELLEANSLLTKLSPTQRSTQQQS